MFGLKVDFTIVKLKILFQTLQSRGFLFYTFSEYVSQENIHEPCIILRHDVEARYEHALKFARIQNELGIKGTYYYRLFHKTPAQAEIIQKIAELGHEIGYHYDDLSASKGDHQKAIQRFENNLNWLRQIAPVKTICMEGAPFSKYDNKDLWKNYNYKYFGILAEPYFDIDFSKVAYFTDTGRRWDGKYAVRDVIGSKKHGEGSRESRYLSGRAGRWPVYKTTNDIIRAVEKGCFPQQVMMTFHPQRWHDKQIPWLKELLWQNIKNQGKRLLIHLRKNAH